MGVSEFLFKGGAKCVSLYGLEGKGKTSIALQAAREHRLTYYISTEGQIEGRISRMGLGERLIVAFAPDRASFLTALAGLSKIDRPIGLIVVDTANSIYRQTWSLKDLYLPLALLKDLSVRGPRVLTVWEMSANNRVAGEKMMRAYCERVLRATGGYILGNNESCKYKVTPEGVLACL